MEDLLADRPTSLADEGLVPLSILRLVNKMIVPPDKKQQQSEDRARSQGEERQGSRRHGFRICRHGIDVKNQPTDTDKHQNGPSDDLSDTTISQAASVSWKGADCPVPRVVALPTTRSWSSAANHDRTQPRPAFTRKRPSSYASETFLRSVLLHFRAAQVHLVTSCSPTSVWATYPSWLRFAITCRIKPRPVELVACPRSTRLCARHFLGHIKYQFAISFSRPREQTPKLAEIACIFARTTQAMSSDDFRFGRFGSSGGFSPS